MSTRCQVEIKATRLGWETEDITLYHHCDGYPTNMLKIIHKAYKAMMKVKKLNRTNHIYSHAWQAGVPGKVASHLCSADPSGFEVEAGNGLHGDIEWFYQIECDKASGSMDEKPTWIVSVYVSGPDFYDKPTKANMMLMRRQEISVIVKQAKDIEDKASDRY